MNPVIGMGGKPSPAVDDAKAMIKQAKTTIQKIDYLVDHNSGKVTQTLDMAPLALGSIVALCWVGIAYIVIKWWKS